MNESATIFPLPASIKDSWQQLQAILPGSLIVYQLKQTHDLRFIFASENIHNVLGINTEKLIKNSELFWSLIHLKDKEQLTSAIESSIQNVSSWRAEFRIHLPEEKERWISWHAQPIQQGQDTVWQAHLIDVTESKRIFQERKKAKQDFHNLANLSPWSTIRYDLNGRINYINKGLAQKLGVNPSDIIGAHPSELWPDGRYGAIVDANKKALAEGKSVTVEFWQAINTPYAIYHHIQVEPEHDQDGNLIGTYAFGLDHTELKRAYDFNEQLFNGLPDPIFAKDRKHRWIWMNDAFCALLGKPRNELIGKSDYDFLPKEQADVFWEKDELVFQSGQENINDEIVSNAEGEHLFIQTKKTLINEETLLGIARDLTQTKQAEAEVRASEEKLRGLFELSPMGIALTDMQGHFLEFNNAFLAICGYTQAELQKLTNQELTPDDYIVQEKQQLEQLNAQGFYGPYEKEFIHHDGHHVSVRLNGVKIHDHTNTPYIWSIVEDITERKNIDAQLRMSASVFDAANEGIAITDRSAHIININPAFTRITGYERSEALGRKMTLLSSGDHGKDFYSTMWSSLLKAGSWSGEIRNRRKNGEIYTQYLNIVTVHDNEGALKHYVSIFTDISKLKQHELHLHYLAHHDALTGLPNRRLLTEKLSHAISQADASETSLAVCYIDLDGFKPINDNHGHELGDRVLLEISERLINSLRDADTVSRIGGDEFVVLLTDITDIKECERTAKRLLDVLSKPIHMNDLLLTVTASLGISIYQNDSNANADSLLRDADHAMYFAKSSGRNQFVFYDAATLGHKLTDNDLLYDLRQALAQTQISVYYQPIIDMATGKIIKAEALARWPHPQHGMIPPSEFIPIAENGGIIHELGDFVFKEALRVAHNWNQQYPATDRKYSISINRSPRQFFHHSGVSEWLRYLKKHQLSGDLLVIEITEGLLLEDRIEILQQLQQLQNAGMEISLDDFGTGYSALSYLKKFPINYLKIDRSFIRDITTDQDDRAIVESIIAMAKRLGIKLVAEGVETSEQAELLKITECEMAQGYYYGKPMPEAEFMDFISKQAP